MLSSSTPRSSISDHAKVSGVVWSKHQVNAFRKMTCECFTQSFSRQTSGSFDSLVCEWDDRTTEELD